mmetsp:Transcript_33861/g.95147  ORF Transcript_33861/g.95147 Transcript_33861/m.95147 type:complete len:250 (+) Transcript_33861:105-854(+)
MWRLRARLTTASMERTASPSRRFTVSCRSCSFAGSIPSALPWCRRALREVAPWHHRCHTRRADRRACPVSLARTMPAIRSGGSFWPSLRRALLCHLCTHRWPSVSRALTSVGLSRQRLVELAVARWNQAWITLRTERRRLVQPSRLHMPRPGGARGPLHLWRWTRQKAQRAIRMFVCRMAGTSCRRPSATLTRAVPSASPALDSVRRHGPRRRASSFVQDARRRTRCRCARSAANSPSVFEMSIQRCLA